MAKQPRSRAAILRASFGRSERLKREAGDGRPAQRERLKAAGPARSERAQQRENGRKPTSPDLARERVTRSRDAWDRQRLKRLEQQTRASFARQADRRRDADRRAEHDRQRQQRQATFKRADDARRQWDRKATERKRDETRRAFTHKADRRRDQAQRAEHDRKQQQLKATLKRAQDFRQKTDRQRADRTREEMRRSFNRDVHKVKETRTRAAAEIDRQHKRQLGDQQLNHRRETSEIRARHQAETLSLRSNESVALERHHHAIKGLDRAEEQALAAFDARRGSLTGRLAERIPGRREENDRARAEIGKEFEAQRMTKHRDLEALKERQFSIAQDARLKQAKERKDIFDQHHNQRGQLADRQKAGRSREIDHQARAFERVDRDRSREIERKEPEREIARPAPAFARA